MNIFEIQTNLLELFNTIEENGGELTEELEEQLVITQEEFNDKVEGYTNIIKEQKAKINLIDEEISRLQQLKKVKKNTIDRLQNVIIEAIDTFGDTKPSGVKYLDYGTGQVSVNTTESVDVDEDACNAICDSICFNFGYRRQYNMLDIESNVDYNCILDGVEKVAEEKEHPYVLTDSDLDNFVVKLSVDVPVSDLKDGKAYNAFKEVAKYDNFNVSPVISKTDIKKTLKTNGSAMPNIAKLVKTEHIRIK